jgi:hypothetical protein
MVEGEVRQEHRPHHRIYVLFEPKDVVFYAAFGLDVIWVETVQISTRPLVCEGLDRGGQGGGGRGLDLPCTDRVDGLGHVLDCLAFPGAHHLQQAGRDVSPPGVAQAFGQGSDQGAELFALLVILAGQQGDGGSLLLPQPHTHRILAVAEGQGGGGFSGHR